MGLLDSKTRILDTIITLEGRRQIASGKLKAEFYSFSDQGAFYELDTSMSGAVDAAKRIYLEASSLPQDMITFESDDSGKLVQFPNSNLTVRNGQILTVITGGINSGSVGTGRVYEPVTDNIFASTANTLLNSSLDSFNKCYIIGSPDVFDETRDEFLLSRNEVDYWVTEHRPIPQNGIQVGDLEATDALFSDARLSHLPNFQYLPPINKYRPGDNTVSLLGIYPNLNQRPMLEFEDVEREISQAEANGYVQTIEITETSKANNLVCQMFELGSNEVTKLDVIDFGLFNITGDNVTLNERQRQESDPRNRPTLTKHVFFVGKIFQDSQGRHKFINLFTLIFE